MPALDRVSGVLPKNPQLAMLARVIDRHRPWFLGIAALAAAGHGQRVINESAQLDLGLRFYVVGALLLILAWMRTEPNLSIRFGARPVSPPSPSFRLAAP